PFNPTTNLEFRSSAGGFVSLKVYDVLGNEITTLINNELSSGIHKVEFDGTGLPSGTYFYRLDAGRYSETKKMVLLK
ncbi:MAG: T9SS type A sorting domain-containing protein, partial [Ignavibacteriaceae bacterium]|nr:T9SS type A sorting domain-containing protein [Ignavibacteriaceae bacterium]